jgi:hypothetical protein
MDSSLGQRANLLGPAFVAPLGLGFALRAFLLWDRLVVYLHLADKSPA